MAFQSLFHRIDCKEKLRSKIGFMRDDHRDHDAFPSSDASPPGAMVVNRKPPLSAVAEAFEELCALSNSGEDLRLKPFCDACSLVSVLFGCLGVAFKFAELEYVAKVRDLTEASNKYGTLNNILDFDVVHDSVKTQGSYSRNLRRVRQGLDLISTLFQNFLSSDFCSLKEAATTAYNKVCAPYHSWTVRTAVSAGMYAIPTREQLLMKLHESDETAEIKMIRYINASRPIIENIDKLYMARNVSLDW